MQLGWSGPRAAVDPVSRKRGVPGVSEQRPSTLEAINWSSLLLERFQSTSLRLPENKGGIGDPEQTRMPQSIERDRWADEAYIGATGLVQKMNLHPMK